MLMLPCVAGFAQDTLTNDLDVDGAGDLVYYEPATALVICRLSSQGFKVMQSSPMDYNEPNIGIRAARNGFEFFVDFMRSGYAAQFRYDKETKRMRLIGMKDYAFGNAVHSGSGSSSVNLLTGDYEGNWNDYDMERDKLVGTPVKGKLQMDRIWLEDFDDKVYEQYAEKSAALYERQKQAVRKRSKGAR